MGLDFDVTKLKLLKSQFINNKYSLESCINTAYPAEVKRLTTLIKGYVADIETIKPFEGQGFTIQIKGAKLMDKKIAGTKIIELATNNANKH